MWKQFFYFTKEERRSMIVLLVLIGLSWGVYQYLTHQPTEDISVDYSEISKEYDDFMASLTLREEEKREQRKQAIMPPVILRPFDPNTADSTRFRELGLPPWIAQRILRYRAKGGVFRVPEQFRKIYGVTDEQYTTLLPYIVIGDEFRKQDTIRYATATVPIHIAEKEVATTATEPFSNSATKAIKHPKGTVISLNKSDTTELKKIPGIGSGYAARIVGYRQKLGGFHAVAQLQEIGIPDSLNQWFRVEEQEITPIHINRASVDRIRAHPYFNFYQAKVIVEHRKKKGKWKRLDQLTFYEEFSAADIERIRPYVSVE